MNVYALTIYRNRRRRTFEITDSIVADSESHAVREAFSQGIAWRGDRVRATVVAPWHTNDDECSVDPETRCCTVCGADHSFACERCGGRGFHQGECLEDVVDLQVAYQNGGTS